MVFKKGMKPWNKGLVGVYRHSFSARKRISESKKGVKRPDLTEYNRITKSSEMLGNKNPNWKNLFCKCGTKLRRSKHIKCRICYLKDGFYGERNSNWKQGVSFQPYSAEFNKKLKSKILKRDKKNCQLCKDNIPTQTKRKFITVHHIDYDKKNNSENNLISLCNFCNSSVNKNREDWTKHFQEVINVESKKI